MCSVIERRDFFKFFGASAGSIISVGVWLTKKADAQNTPRYSVVIVDYNKCTGCRTCETVCSQAHDKVMIDGEETDGIGNPRYTRIHVYGFSPPVDVPVHCMECKDAPCIAACPVEPDNKTGRKALYRDEKTQAIRNDYERCIGCGNCAKACTDCRIGAIMINAKTGKPESVCDLCNGDPVCVKRCPYDALSHLTSGFDGGGYACSPGKIAEELIKLWYTHH
jgi:Fe-S-cluster-containing hydrogenase component 2